MFTIRAKPKKQDVKNFASLRFGTHVSCDQKSNRMTSPQRKYTVLRTGFYFFLVSFHQSIGYTEGHVVQQA